MKRMLDIYPFRFDVDPFHVPKNGPDVAVIEKLFDPLVFSTPSINIYAVEPDLTNAM